jgi:hypothetical protein
MNEFDVENSHTGSGGTKQCNFGMDVSGMGLSTIVIH